MCELMALCFAKPISADFSVREFGPRGEENADGWGLAWYPDRSVTIVKEPVRWRASKYSGFLETYSGLKSCVCIAHVRHKTTGGIPTHADTHPFARELDGRDYCFAHNGTLEGPFHDLPLGRYQPIGATDSEHLFCHLMAEIAAREDRLGGEASWRWLHSKLAAVNGMGRLNCVLSDGERVYCYHDRAGWKGLVVRRVRMRDEEPRRFEDPGVQIELEGQAFNTGLVVATRPLSANGWHSFHAGELMVLERGAICFSSHRSAPDALGP
jgi:predicted glutamine amidotransferase